MGCAHTSTSKQPTAIIRAALYQLRRRWRRSTTVFRFHVELTTQNAGFVDNERIQIWCISPFIAKPDSCGAFCFGNRFEDVWVEVPSAASVDNHIYFLPFILSGEFWFIFDVTTANTLHVCVLAGRNVLDLFDSVSVIRPGRLMLALFWIVFHRSLTTRPNFGSNGICCKNGPKVKQKTRKRTSALSRWNANMNIWQTEVSSFLFISKHKWMRFSYSILVFGKHRLSLVVGEEVKD